MPVYFKVCPRCGQSAQLRAAACRGCGHVYRTVFVAPGHHTAAVPVARSRWNVRRPALVGIILAVVIAGLLAITNPNEDDLAAWAMAQSQRVTSSPQSDAELAGEMIGRAMTPALIRNLVARWNFLLFSIFRPRQGAQRIFLGACGHICPIPPMEEASDAGGSQNGPISTSETPVIEIVWRWTGGGGTSGSVRNVSGQPIQGLGLTLQDPQIVRDNGFTLGVDHRRIAARWASNSGPYLTEERMTDLAPGEERSFFIERDVFNLPPPDLMVSYGPTAEQPNFNIRVIHKRSSRTDGDVPVP